MITPYPKNLAVKNCHYGIIMNEYFEAKNGKNTPSEEEIRIINIDSTL